MGRTFEQSVRSGEIDALATRSYAVAESPVDVRFRLPPNVRKAYRLGHLQNGEGFVNGMSNLEVAAERVNGSHLIITEEIQANTLPSEKPVDAQQDRVGVRSRYFISHNATETLQSPLIKEYLPTTSVNALALLSNKEFLKERESKRKNRVLGEIPTEEEARAYELSREEELFRLEERVTLRTNLGFYRSISRNFDLPEIKDESDNVGIEASQNFLSAHLRPARETWSTLMATVAPHRGDLELKNEVSIPPEYPSDFVALYANPDTHPSLRSQSLQIPLLAEISAERSKRDKEVKPARHLARIQNLLNHKLYKSGAGNTEEKVIRALYNKDSNEVLGVEGIDGLIFMGAAPQDTQYKTRHFAVRDVPDLGLQVLTRPNEKTEAASIIKAIKKARNRGDNDWIDVADVQDTHRMMFVVLGGEEEKDLLAMTLEDIFSDPKNQKYLCDKDIAGRPLDQDGNPIDRTGKNSEDFATELKGRWLATQDDSNINGAPDQAKVQFKRLQVTFDGLDRDIEIQIYSMAQHLNTIYHTGIFDRSTGRFTGQSHELYENRRSTPVADSMIDANEYNGINLKGESTKAAHKTVKELKMSERGYSKGR